MTKENSIIGVQRVEQTTPNVLIQHLPCKIHHDGPAEIDKYFLPGEESPDEKQHHQAISEDENAQQTAHISSFRGRRLKGTDISLPDGVVGVVWKESIIPESQEGECGRFWAAAGAFHRGGLRCWGHDAAPGPGHPLPAALGWLELAAQIHAPVEEDEDESNIIAG